MFSWRTSVNRIQHINTFKKRKYYFILKKNVEIEFEKVIHISDSVRIKKTTLSQSGK